MAGLKLLFKRVVPMVLTVALSSNLMPSVARATGNLATRSVSSSNSAVGAPNVTYTFTFTPSTTATPIRGIQFLACTTPYPQSSCAAPTGFTFAGAGTGTSPTIATNIGGITTNWVKDAASTANDARYTYAVNATNPTAVTFAFNGITNETGTVNIPPVYIRIFTYNTATMTGNNWNQTGDGVAGIDEANVVMQPVQTVITTGIVQEQLTFCLYDNAGTCATGITAPVAIGVLSSGTLTTPAANKFDIKTNAASGATIQYTASQFAGPNQNIPAGTAQAHTVVSPAAGTESFGLSLSSAAGNVTGTNGYAGAYAIRTDGTPDLVANITSTQTGTGTLSYTANINSATKPGKYQATFVYQAIATF